jgi:hypothetical protein
MKILKIQKENQVMRNNITKYFNLILIVAGFLIVSCDDRVPETTDSDMNLTLTTQPVAIDLSGNLINVGEDVSGILAYTLVTASVLSDSNEAVENVEVNFSATLDGEGFGSFDSPTSLTNDNGVADALLFDLNSSGTDIKIKAEIDGDISKTETITIVDTTEVWPYRLYVSVDNSQIFIDNGVTNSNISARILNYNYQPIENLEVSFELQPDGLGILTSSSANTDTSGIAQIQLIDTGNPEDVGTVTILSSYKHPSFGELDVSIYVSISSPSNLNLTLTTLPVGIDQQTVVGEDIVGEYAYTLVTALLKDQDGNPVAGKVISFNSSVNNQSSGSFNVSSGTTNSQGMVVVYFIDSGSAVDVSGTPAYEGVIVTGYYSNDVTASDGFNVYESQNDVWPYNLILFSDTDVINLDGGQTTATVTARLLNNQNDPAKFVAIAFDATKGFIDAIGITDSTGLVDVTFSDLGNPEDVGVANIEASFVHPSFGEITDNIQITIVDTAYSGTPAYLEIPSSYPSEIMVVGGGGSESTDICARVFDESGVLVDEPVSVTFTLGPNIPIGANINNIGTIDSSYTADGEACVSLNSGTGPGPIRVTAVLVYEGEEISATAIPVIIATGPPANIEAEYDPLNTLPVGGGYYQTEASAMVYDLWYNPVADSTYIYWTIDPIPPDTLIEAFVEGVSYTGNPNLNGDSYSGLAFTTIIYSTDAIGDIGYVTALTFGADGDTVSVRINEEEGEATMTFVPGTLILSAATTYVDFTALGASTVQLNITGTLQDYYGNPVNGAPIAMNAPGAANIYWPIIPIANNVGTTDQNGQVTWVVEYDIGICAWIVGTDDPTQYEDFTSSLTATLLIAQSITSDPIDILLVRTPIGP